jgi:hypothetical protein
VVTQRSFDWVSRHDPRSRNYSIAAVRPIVEPVARSWRTGPVLDQRSEGACVGFGCALELSSSPIRVPDVDDAFARQLYRDARDVDRVEHDLNWPDGASVLAGAKVLRARGFIDSFRWAFSVEELRAAIITAGPAILGLNWYDSMYDTDESGMVEVSGELVGGHCILCYGYHPSMRVPGWRGRHEVFRWQNSWGLSYGVNGRGIVRIEDMARLLAENGESCVPVGRDFGVV